MTLKTPIYELKNYLNVYEPQEDTFLLLDALEMEMDLIKKANPIFVLEVGSGSGIVITAICSILNVNSICFATDINFEACLATKHTASLNNVCIDVCRMNLAINLKSKLFDLIIFNPPYVVTESNEIKGTGIERSWAGGKDGRQIIDVFLKNLSNILCQGGVCYMVLLKENDPQEIMFKMNDLNFETTMIKERKILGEHLYIIKLKLC